MSLLLKSLRRQLPSTPPCNLGPVRLVFQWKFTCSLSPVCLASKMTNAIKCELCMYEMGSKMNVRLMAKCKLYCDSDWNSTIYKISLVWVQACLSNLYTRQYMRLNHSCDFYVILSEDFSGKTSSEIHVYATVNDHPFPCNLQDGYSRCN